MPEGDTIHRAAAALDAALSGHAVTAFEAPRARGPRPQPGELVDRVEAVGKHLVMRFSGGVTLRTHQAMTGAWMLHRPGERWRRPRGAMRVMVETAEWTAVCFAAPVVELTRTTPERLVALSGLGPDLTRAEADLGEALRRLRELTSPEATTAEVLLDQRITSGIGNVHKAETLWSCRVSPFALAADLDDDAWRRLFERAARGLRGAAGPLGGARSTAPGGAAVYGRAGRACPRCSSPIRVAGRAQAAAAGERLTYWCERCQPTPPGRPIRG
ncbi:MAG: DNA-formamidopyrimidine glycosylase family protein [Acidimicrobiales bacterium]